MGACGPEPLMYFFRSIPWYMMASALYSDVYPERVIHDHLGLGHGHRWVFTSLVGYFDVAKNRTQPHVSASNQRVRGRIRIGTVYVGDRYLDQS